MIDHIPERDQDSKDKNFYNFTDKTDTTITNLFTGVANMIISRDADGTAGGINVNEETKKKYIKTAQKPRTSQFSASMGHCVLYYAVSSARSMGVLSI